MRNPPPFMKAFDFIRPPFGSCPKCGVENVFGNLMISGNQHTRRCRACQHTQSFPLPPLNVSVIYLDQNILSNMLLILDPATPEQKLRNLKSQKHFEFYKKVFEKLHRLSKLHLLVCPHSSTHHDESLVSANGFKKLKRLYELLSSGTSFLRSDEIRNIQLYAQAANYLSNPDGSMLELSKDDVMRGKLNAWRDWFQISLNCGEIDGLEESLCDGKCQKYNGFAEVWKGWRSETSRPFYEWYREERMALSKVLKDKLTLVFRRKLEIRFGQREICLEDILPDDNEVLLFDLHKIFCDDQPDLAGFKHVWRFLESNALDMVPHVRISSLIYATLAGRASRGQKLPNRHPFNDIDVISAYLPYCNAMYLDKEMEVILNEGPMRKELGYPTQIFSIAKKGDFLAFLDSVEANAPFGHIEKVREVYGNIWEDPFVDIFQTP